MADYEKVQYAEWVMEFQREKLGLAPDDKSKDDEIIAFLQSGEKLSKSTHINKS